MDDDGEDAALHAFSSCVTENAASLSTLLSFGEATSRFIARATVRRSKDADDPSKQQFPAEDPCTVLEQYEGVYDEIMKSCTSTVGSQSLWEKSHESVTEDDSSTDYYTCDEFDADDDDDDDDDGNEGDQEERHYQMNLREKRKRKAPSRFEEQFIVPEPGHRSRKRATYADYDYYSSFSDFSTTGQLDRHHRHRLKISQAEERRRVCFSLFKLFPFCAFHLISVVLLFCVCVFNRK